MSKTDTTNGFTAEELSLQAACDARDDKRAIDERRNRRTQAQGDSISTLTTKQEEIISSLSGIKFVVLLNFILTVILCLTKH